MTQPLKFHSHRGSDDVHTIWWKCPCGSWHSVPVEGGKAWGWDGDIDCPTFTQSVRVRGGRAETGTEYCCHSSVKSGAVNFYPDCTHASAGEDGVEIEATERPAWLCV